MRPPPFLPDFHKPLILNFYPFLWGLLEYWARKGEEGKKGGGGL
tara:strand:+ start:362 stop:493 length:132 start_codon:yes stop_codon:yes gene_type:complete